MKKKLIVSGCSFTDSNFVSCTSPDYDVSFKKWPEIIAEKLDMDLVNLGASGAGNEYIYTTLFEEITRTPKDQIGMVMAAWSQVNREDYQNWVNVQPGINYSLADRFHKNMLWRNVRIGRRGDVFYYIKDTLRKYIALQNLCKLYNIPYKQFQMINPFMGYLHGLSKTDWEIVANLNNPNFKKRWDYKKVTANDFYHCCALYLEYEQFIDTENFIGYPPLNKFDGYCIEYKSIMYENGNNFEDCIVSELDAHPNKKGHEKIAEFIYGQLENRLQK